MGRSRKPLGLAPASPSLRLRARQQPSPRDPGVAGLIRLEPVPRAATPAVPNEGPTRILIVGPSRLACDSMALMLQSAAGVTVVACATEIPRIAELVSRLAPSVVLLDLREDLLPGLEAAARIVAGSPGISVAALLPPIQPHHVGLLLRSGVSCFVHHDVVPHEVHRAMKRLATGRCPHVDGQSWCSRSLEAQSGTRPEPRLRDHLTRREGEVLHFLIRGHSSSEIGTRLFISARTVENHVGSLFRKLGLHDKRALSCPGYRHAEEGPLAVERHDVRACDCRSVKPGTRPIPLRAR